MTYNKLPGGYAHGMEKKDFSKKDQTAIDKGSKIEAEEHGKSAPKEIAADHVAEHGSIYYNDKKGLPAMEAKLEKTTNPSEHLKQARIHTKEGMKASSVGDPVAAKHHHQQAAECWSKYKSATTKPVMPMQKADNAIGKPIPYDPQNPLSPAGHIAQSRLHNKHGQQAGASGDPIAAQWHHQQALLHYKATKGPVEGYKPEEYVINTKSENPMVHEPSLQKESDKFERCVHHVKDQNVSESGSEKKPVNPWAVCHASVDKSIKYASGELSKSIKSDCPDCNTKQHNQWVDSARKSDSCKKCGTPLNKASKLPEDMPNDVRLLSKAQNAVHSMEASESLKKYQNFLGGAGAPKVNIGDKDNISATNIASAPERDITPPPIAPTPAPVVPSPAPVVPSPAPVAAAPVPVAPSPAPIANKPSTLAGVNIAGPQLDIGL